MIGSLDNRMLFGALQNLKLAPHVREGRLGPPAPAPMPAARPTGTSERLTLSAEALARLGGDGAGAVASPSSGSDPAGGVESTIASTRGTWYA